MSVSTNINVPVVPSLSTFGMAKCSGMMHPAFVEPHGGANHVQVNPGQLSRIGLNSDCMLRSHTESDALGGLSQATPPPQPAKRRKASDGAGHGSAPKQSDAAPPASPANRPPSSVDLGPNLLSAYRLLDAAGFWFEKLADEYINILMNIGKASDFSFAGKPLEVMDDAFSGGDDWLCNGWHWTVTGRHQRQRIGALSFMIDLGKPGRPAHAIGQPCALVVWSGVAYDWLPSLSLAGGFWPPTSETTRLLDGRLVQWTGMVPGNGPSGTLPMHSRSWFYVLPLAALTSFSRLRELVVQPALELLNGTPVEAVFANLPEAMKFNRRKGDLVTTA